MSGDKHKQAGADREAVRAEARERLRVGRIDLGAMPTEDVEALVHELEVHQAELEVQNEELRRTELGLAELVDRYRDLYDFAPVGYLTLDGGSVVREANLALAKLCNRERAAIIGQRIERLISPEDRDACYICLRDAAASRKRASCEFRIERGGSPPLWALAEVAAIVDAEDAESECKGFRVTITDISERKRDQDALRALASQLSRAEQRERKRVASILHDHIQQIIVSAQMKAAWMTRADDLKRVHTVARSILDTLRQALDASRSLAVDLSPPVLAETGLVGCLNWLASHMLEKHHFNVNLHVSAAAEPPTEDARFLVFECVRELLLNVVKHAGVREADVALMRPETGQIKVIVRDQGKGFDPDAVKKRRADEMSFGLFSIQERLAHLGGRAEIESAPGKGTHVALTLPVSEDQRRPDEKRDAKLGERRGERINLRRKQDLCRLLIVDDHAIVREGLAGLFQFEPDIEVVGEAADGPEAVRLAAELKPDVIIMDVNLGEMDGVEATRQILAENPEIKVVGLSMHTDVGVADAMREAGAVAYLTKGGPSEELIARIRASFRG